MGASFVSEAMVIRSHAGPYQVHFDDDILAHVDSDFPNDAHAVVDFRVAELNAERLAGLLARPSTLRIEATERNKSLERFPAYVDHLVRHQVRRDHCLIAVGGGIIQDIACFLASTFLRGIAWKFVPTTLLAQADSCIGSKSSINSGGAKNILGTFNPPRSVFISGRFLDTLDERDVRSGLGEMLKAHAIDGPAAFDAIAAAYDRIVRDRATMLSFLRRSLEIKKRYIEEDEFDRGPRNVFNYGHTFGHAIEAASNFTIPHGIAVTIGMDMANRAAVHFGVGDDAFRRRMHPVLAANYRGFESHPVALGPFLAAIAKDKKNTGADCVSLILPDCQGRIVKGIYPNDAAFARFCEDYLERGRP